MWIKLGVFAMITFNNFGQIAIVTAKKVHFCRLFLPATLIKDLYAVLGASTNRVRIQLLQALLVFHRLEIAPKQALVTRSVPFAQYSVRNRRLVAIDGRRG